MEKHLQHRRLHLEEWSRVAAADGLYLDGWFGVQHIHTHHHCMFNMDMDVDYTWMADLGYNIYTSPLHVQYV